MIIIKLFITLGIILPLVFVSSVLAGPFCILCCLTGEQETLKEMLDRIGDRMQSVTANFVDPDNFT